MQNKKIENILKHHAQDIIIITDKNGFISWVNDWFTELTGYTFEEVKGKKPGSFLQGEETNKSTINNMKAAISSGNNFNYNVINYSKKGKKYWLNINCSPVFDNNNEIEFFIAIQRDITSEYQKNQSNLNQLIEEQQKLSSEKTQLIELIHLLTHDLKAPLNNIEGLLKMLKLKNDDISTMINSEIHRSRALIDKILANGNNSSTKIKLEISNFSLLELIEKLTQANTNSVTEKMLRINIDCPKDINLNSDKVLITQVFENLFVNAVKYSNNSSQIDFEVTEESETVTIVISNETDQLQDWQIPKLFEPFQNFSIQSTNKSSGVGTYIVQKYIDLVGGVIDVFKVEKRVSFRIRIKK